MFEQLKTYYLGLIPDLPEEDWQQLESKLTVQHLKKGAILTKNGDICRSVSFVNRGLLRMFYLVDGKEINMAFVPEKEYLSEYESFLTLKPANANVDALEDTELINLSYEDIQWLYKSNPVFEQAGRKIAEMLFITISSAVTRLLVMSPEERYQYLLINEPFVIQRVPQYMIASYIGITPEHLSRIRKKIAAGNSY
jgi:CRP/FNR family transcriptional regulator, anaerobic regulatory protein